MFTVIHRQEGVLVGGQEGAGGYHRRHPGRKDGELHVKDTVQAECQLAGSGHVDRRKSGGKLPQCSGIAVADGQRDEQPAGNGKRNVASDQKRHELQE